MSVNAIIGRREDVLLREAAIAFARGEVSSILVRTLVAKYFVGRPVNQRGARHRLVKQSIDMTARLEISLEVSLELALNRLAQGLDPVEGGVSWFNGMAVDDRRMVLRKLGNFVSQARATVEDGRLAVIRSGVRPTVTPAVLLVRSELSASLSKLSGLPEAELERAFRLLVLTLGIADQRRRALFCADGCSHWWHHLPPGLQAD
nr:hypothetical protein GCM10020063_053090 [Dactylosporangium thailandense]